MCLKMSDIISFIKLDKSRCISLLLCFWHINCLILMVIYPNNYSNFRTIMEVIMKNKWLLCILLMLFLPFGLFAQVAPPLEKQKTETQEAPENNNEVTTNSDTNTDGDAGKTIKGVINDEQGETIIGASVIIKGEDTGTTSDMDGRFTLEAPEGAILVISYIGYHTQEVKVRKRSLLRVVLKEDNQLLDEVVVVTGFAVEYHVLRRAGHESFVLGTWIMAIVDFMMAAAFVSCSYGAPELGIFAKP